MSTGFVATAKASWGLGSGAWSAWGRTALVVGLVAGWSAPLAQAGKRVVCVNIKKDAGMEVEDGFLSSAEGWERSQLDEDQGDVLVRGGALTDCLDLVENGDTLVIVAHGLADCCAQQVGTGFRWCGEEYSGFGPGGPPLMAVPQDFADLENVTVEFLSCYSATDPDGAGPNTSMTAKILAAMGNDPSNTASGYLGRAVPQNDVSIAGWPMPDMTDREKQAYLQLVSQCIDDPAVAATWPANPPTNRPGSRNGPNQLTALQAIVDACDEFTDDNRPTMVLTYAAPQDDMNVQCPNGEQAGPCIGPCAPTATNLSGPPAGGGIPALPTPGLAVLAGALLVLGVGVLRHRTALG